MATAWRRWRWAGPPGYRSWWSWGGGPLRAIRSALAPGEGLERGALGGQDHAHPAGPGQDLYRSAGQFHPLVQPHDGGELQSPGAHGGGPGHTGSGGRAHPAGRGGAPHRPAGGRGPGARIPGDPAADRGGHPADAHPRGRGRAAVRDHFGALGRPGGGDGAGARSRAGRVPGTGPGWAPPPAGIRAVQAPAHRAPAELPGPGAYDGERAPAGSGSVRSSSCATAG